MVDGIGDRERELRERALVGLRHDMGPVVLEALNDPDVVEVFLNDDGTLWAEKFGEMKVIGEMSEDAANLFLRQVASHFPGQSLCYQNPFVEGELPLDGSRFEGVTWPVVERPIFNIRKKASRVYPLSEYVAKGILPFGVSEMLRSSIIDAHNILVVGGTGSGKTTFCNALLHTLAEVAPACRMLIMEDVRELQCALRNKSFLRSYEHASLRKLSTVLMRMRPDRISVGEIRSGEVAIEVLKAWNTGHPGGFCTIHANSAYEGLDRLDEMLGEVSAASQARLIGRAVQVAVFMCRTPKGRRVKEVLRVNGYDVVRQKFDVKVVYED